MRIEAGSRLCEYFNDDRNQKYKGCPRQWLKYRQVREKQLTDPSKGYEKHVQNIADVLTHSPFASLQALLPPCQRPC